MNTSLSRSPRERSGKDPVFLEPVDVSRVLDSAVEGSPYRHNAFRLAGLWADAARRELHTRVVELAMHAYLGGPPRGVSVLPVSPPPDLVEVQTALHRLRDPVRRLVQEVFWFWPVDGDPAWDAFVGNDPGRAVLVGEPDRYVRAASGNRRAQPGDTPPCCGTGGAEHEHGRAAARDALRYWDGAHFEEAFWEHLAGRAEAIGNRRIDRRTVAELRRSLPDALLRIHSAIISRGGPDAIIHLTVLNNLAKEASRCPETFTTEAVDRARHRAARELSGRVKTIAEEERRTAATRPVYADSTANRMLDRVREPLELLDRICPPGDPIRDGAHDDLIRAARFCLTEYGDETMDFMTIETVFRRVEPIADTDAARHQVATDRADIAELRLHQIFDEARKELEKSKGNGARAAHQILDNAQPVLAVLGVVRSADDRYLRAIHDQVVEEAVAYSESSGDLDAAADLLAEIAPFAITTGAQELLRHNTSRLSAAGAWHEDPAPADCAPTSRTTRGIRPEAADRLYSVCLLVALAALLVAWAGYPALYVPCGIAVVAAAALHRIAK